MSETKKKYLIKIEFLPDDKGNTYELESIKLKVRALSKEIAKEMGKVEARKNWPNFLLYIEKI